MKRQWLRRSGLLLLALLLALPLYAALIAASHAPGDLLGRLPWLPGNRLLHNLRTVLGSGLPGSPSVLRMLGNSLVMALGIALGKLTLATLSAYAVVYFRFPLRRTAFVLILSSLMLPLEVRFYPTFQVSAGLHLLNSYGVLIVPLIASATATFLLRQFFASMPPSLLDAARMDGAGPMQFFLHSALPLARTPLAALFVLEFVYGWNQYLWPLLTTTDARYATVVMGMQGLINAGTSFALPRWDLVMTTALLALLPPLLVLLLAQRWFIRGLTDIEK